jgi:1-aminocyclopropane-1-carboxylate deaminase/D-cysteine desulfhydrase-like pyridoxal-dependent ACC family enzyme
VRLEGMITDPVYEGKSMQGIIELVQKGFSPTDRKCFMRILAALLPLTAIAIHSATVKGVLS